MSISEASAWQNWYPCRSLMIFLTQFLYQAVYPENPEEIQVIVGSMNMGYDSLPRKSVFIVWSTTKVVIICLKLDS